MGKWIFALLLWVSFSLGIALTRDRELSVDGEIAIDPQGTVSDCRIKTSLDDDFKTHICNAVMKWRFEPVLMRGEPVSARSAMYLILKAQEAGDGYRVSVGSALFSGSRAGTVSLLPPQYPKDELRAGLMADVLVAVRVDGNGDVLDAVVAQTPWINIKRGGGSRAKPFERAALTAAKTWKFAPADLDRESSPEVTVLVPVMFRLGDMDFDFGATGWRADATTARPIPWLEEDRQQYDVTGLKRGQTMALHNDFKLLSDVVGRSL